jgi:hypothetical protein
MEIAFLLSAVLLILFALLGLYDGFYLHIWKYRLHEKPESQTEHATHTIRAVLFPAILYFLYLRQDCTVCFYIGLTLVLADILTLITDAWLEKDSRGFMGGLPRWEYIIHLLVNGFHFASIAVALVLKIQLVNNQVFIRTEFPEGLNHNIFMWLVGNLIPGAILMAAIHVITMFPFTRGHWHSLRERFTCC